jgi:hypothetical protein
MASIFKSFRRSACVRSAQQPNDDTITDVNRGGWTRRARYRRNAADAAKQAAEMADGAVALAKLEEYQRWLDTMHPPRPDGAVDPRGATGSDWAMSRARGELGGVKENTDNWRLHSEHSLYFRHSIVGEAGEMGYHNTDDMYAEITPEGKWKARFTDIGQTKSDAFKKHFQEQVRLQVPAGAAAARETAETYAGRFDFNVTFRTGMIF